MPEKNPARPASFSELSQLLMSLDNLLVSCMRCGLCQAVCPVYGSTFREADVTRGKISLLENLAHETIKDAKSVNERLNRCLLCGSCQANCPSGVNVMEIFIKARSFVAAYLGLSFVKKLIFRRLLTHPRLFNLATNLSGFFQKPFLKRVNATVGSYRAPLLTPFLGNRHVPSFPGHSFTGRRGALNKPAGQSKLKVALFPGCVPDKLFDRLSEATLKILDFHGVGVFTPNDLVCCGIPALASGDSQGFLGLTGQNLTSLSRSSFDYLVTPCATCAANIKENWPRFMDRYLDWEKKLVVGLSPKTMDITQFLVSILKVDFTPATTKAGAQVVTYHDSCHLKKSLGVSAQPRAIIKSLPDYRLVEMPEADRCCGHGGSFNLFHYDLSREIGQRKRANIVSVKPSLVATGCPACMTQLMDMLSQNNDQIAVKHVVELYADSLGAAATRRAS
ncbi:MAG: (Fe-S)-binding protein [Deltaproteobacteria bacterium]|jgi:glycolate oxidase iron-sulfur subunit|nr:(Fe-S)-binding protein [Deltaproteobacteria bacterium]